MDLSKIQKLSPIKIPIWRSLNLDSPTGDVLSVVNIKIL